MGRVWIIFFEVFPWQRGGALPKYTLVVFLERVQARYEQALYTYELGPYSS
jgi:hypothetical protein